MKKKLTWAHGDDRKKDLLAAMDFSQREARLTGEYPEIPHPAGWGKGYHIKETTMPESSSTSSEP